MMSVCLRQHVTTCRRRESWMMTCMFLWMGRSVISSSNSCCHGSTTTSAFLSMVSMSSDTQKNTKRFSRIPVLQYHNDWVCVNKPAGISVHPNRQSYRKPTLKSRLKRQLARKVFSVHRLDHRTSGAILFAFDSQTSGELHSSLKRGTKQYIALLRGAWRHDNDTHVVNEPLRVHEIEKEAKTKFTVLSSYASNFDNNVAESQQQEYGSYSGDCCLVLAEPQTGRTHQIRRHARAMGHPVLGDTEHGDSKVNRWWRTKFGLNRLGLHCLSLSISTKSANETTTIVAPVTADLRSVLQHQTELWENAVWKEPRLLLDSVDETGGTFGRNYRKRRRTADEIK